MCAHFNPQRSPQGTRRAIIWNLCGYDRRSIVETSIDRYGVSSATVLIKANNQPSCCTRGPGSGSIIYPAVALKDGFDAGLRVEYFKELEAGGVAYGAGNSVIDATLTASYTTKDLRLIAELRLDQSSTAQFNSMTSDQLSSFILAAVYSF